MKHVHAELIKAWADGAEIEALGASAGKWYPVATPQWFVDVSYRIKPERVYPKSSLSDKDLQEAWVKSPAETYGVYRAIADAAVKRYIQENESK